jgi:hypothetical protein
VTVPEDRRGAGVGAILDACRMNDYHRDEAERIDRDALPAANQ